MAGSRKKNQAKSAIKIDALKELLFKKVFFFKVNFAQWDIIY